MQDDAVADRDPAPHDARDAGVGMDHREVLDVRLFTDRDPVRIASEDRVIPDAGVPADVDVAEDDRPLSDENGRIDHADNSHSHKTGSSEPRSPSAGRFY